jgi:hypothetical protein
MERAIAHPDRPEETSHAVKGDQVDAGMGYEGGEPTDEISERPG